MRLTLSINLKLSRHKKQHLTQYATRHRVWDPRKLFSAVPLATRTVTYSLITFNFFQFVSGNNLHTSITFKQPCIPEKKNVKQNVNSENRGSFIILHCKNWHCKNCYKNYYVKIDIRKFQKERLINCFFFVLFVTWTVKQKARWITRRDDMVGVLF